MVREKRRFTRITLNVPATLSLYQVEAYHSGAIANICMGGCYFPFGEELPVGDQCNVTITVGEGLETEQITIAGQIVRSDSKGVGIKFTESSEDSRQQLEKIIVQHEITP
ncbi:MAG: PilZ domain-containing protein [Desulforhopalus sp.]